MARGGHKRKKAKPIARDDVTAERATHNEIASIGMARRIVPAIDVLLKRGDITETEHKALTYYRDQASLADKSPTRSCCDFSVRGEHGPGVAIMSAAIETGRIERDLGALLDIARAVAVDDKSLTEWCVSKHGGRERYNGDGKFIAIVPINEKRHIQMARMELRMAAHRITQ